MVADDLRVCLDARTPGSVVRDLDHVAHTADAGVALLGQLANGHGVHRGRSLDQLGQQSPQFAMIRRRKIVAPDDRGRAVPCGCVKHDRAEHGLFGFVAHAENIRPVVVDSSLVTRHDCPTRKGDDMKAGDVVKFAEPMSQDEEFETFLVVEMRGPRVLVSLIGSGMSIVPTFVYLASDLKVMA